jgi:hypothetical protein
MNASLLSVVLLANAVGSMTITDAVNRVRDTTNDAQGLRQQAERADDAALPLDNLRFGIEHRSVDQFVVPRLDDLGTPLESTDNVALSLQVPLPQLTDLLQRNVDGSTADAELALLAEQRLERARAVANDASAFVALKAEQALLAQELRLAATLLQLQRERRDSQHATGTDVDDAQRLRVKLVGEALDVDDDLVSARRKLLTTVGSDAIDDDLEARCSQGLPAVQQLVDAAVAASPKQAAAQALRRAVEQEEQAWRLGFLPWPRAVEGTWINRDRLRVDDYRLRLDINIPLLHAFDGSNDGLVLRQRAVEQEAALADQQLRADIAALHDAATRRQELVREMALDTTAAPPTDPAEALETQLANLDTQRRRLRALGRCAASVMELHALTR